MLQLPSEFQHERFAALASPIRYLFIFSPNLSDHGLHTPASLSRLEELFSGSPNFELRLILRSDLWLRESSASLRSLLERRAAQTHIRIAQGEALKAQDAFLLTDMAVVKQMVASQPWGVAYVGDPEQTRLLLSRWEALWESSEPMLPFRSLGL